MELEDLENARSSAAKGSDDKKQQVVESSETQVTPTARLSLSQHIAERLEAWGVESRGAISLFVILNLVGLLIDERFFPAV
jgi:hypothetical protein